MDRLNGPTLPKKFFGCPRAATQCVYELSAIQKSAFFEKSKVLSFLLSNFCIIFAKKQTFCYSSTFFLSLITHKRFIFEESYISYGKR